jgi:hypothetical protein
MLVELHYIKKRRKKWEGGEGKRKEKGRGKEEGERRGKRRGV